MLGENTMGINSAAFCIFILCVSEKPVVPITTGIDDATAFCNNTSVAEGVLKSTATSAARLTLDNDCIAIPVFVAMKAPAS